MNNEYKTNNKIKQMLNSGKYEIKEIHYKEYKNSNLTAIPNSYNNNTKKIKVLKEKENQENYNDYNNYDNYENLYEQPKSNYKQQYQNKNNYKQDTGENKKKSYLILLNADDIGEFEKLLSDSFKIMELKRKY